MKHIIGFDTNFNQKFKSIPYMSNVAILPFIIQFIIMKLISCNPFMNEIANRDLIQIQQQSVFACKIVTHSFFFVTSGLCVRASHQSSHPSEFIENSVQFTL